MPLSHNLPLREREITMAISAIWPRTFCAHCVPRMVPLGKSKDLHLVQESTFVILSIKAPPLLRMRLTDTVVFGVEGKLSEVSQVWLT